MKNELLKLLNELAISYSNSDIQHNKYCKENNRKWAYELIQTALIEQQPLIIGFNWGVDNTWKEYIEGRAYQHQQNIVKQSFVDVYKGSIERSMTMCKKYFPEITFENGSHSNYCFFQSEKEHQISENDIQLCIPIFRKLIEIVNPSVVFCFSSKAREHMISHQLVYNVKQKKFTTIDKKGNSCIAAKGTLNNGSTVYFLPHPNYRLKREIRNMAWEFCSI